MDVDLTCPTCKGEKTVVAADGRGHASAACGGCGGEGRVRPSLRQWDALVALAEALAEALGTFTEGEASLHARAYGFDEATGKHFVYCPLCRTERPCRYDRALGVLRTAQERRGVGSADRRGAP